LSALKLIHTQTLSNGLKISIHDLTRVYFGDYYHVRVKVVCSLDNDAVDWQQYFPECLDLRSISYSRIIEKMGVPSDEIESVTKSLLSEFDRNSLPYIASADFPKKLITNEHSCKKSFVRKYLGSGS